MEILLEAFALFLIGKVLVELISGTIVLRLGWSTVYRYERPGQYWLLLLIDAGLAAFVSRLAYDLLSSRR